MFPRGAAGASVRITETSIDKSCALIKGLKSQHPKPRDSVSAFKRADSLSASLLRLSSLICSVIPGHVMILTTAVTPPGRCEQMDSLNPTVHVPIHGVTSRGWSFVQVTHRAIERYRATIITALIVVLAFAVAIHFPSQAPTFPQHFRGR